MKKINRKSQGDLPLVVHVIHALGTGGLENGLINIINRMPANRYRHCIVCLTRSGNFAQRIIASNVEIKELDKKPGHDFWVYWKLWEILFQLKPSIVHTRNLSAMEMQIVAFFIPGVKRVHGEHGRDIFDLDGKNRKYNQLRKVMSIFIQQYICVSKDLRSWLIDVVGIKPSKVKLIYNGVDQESFKSSKREQADNKIVIGTVGRLAAVKNQKMLVQAMQILRDLNPEVFANIQLLLVGDGPQRPEIESLIQQARLEQKVELLGDCENIAELLNKMDIFLLPSLAEGVSNTILEAMATALPVIATRVGGNVELVTEGESGLLITSEDAAGMASAIAFLAQNSEKRTEMGQAGLARVQQDFNWSITVKEYLAVYDRLIGA